MNFSKYDTGILHELLKQRCYNLAATLLKISEIESWQYEPILKKCNSKQEAIEFLRRLSIVSRV